MKQIFSILAIATLISCTPEEPTIQQNCNCGTIVKVTQPSPFIQQFLVEVKSDCNNEIFYITNTVHNRVGTKICK